MKTRFPAVHILCLLGACMAAHSPLSARGAGDEADWPIPAYEENDAREADELPHLDEHSTLRDYLIYAALNNPGLEAAFTRWKAASEKAAQAESLPDPQFTYAHFIEEVETRVGPQQSRFGLMQRVPWFGKRTLRGDVATEAANTAFHQYQAAKLKLFYEVKKAYYEYYFLYRAIGITEDNIQLLRHLEGVAQTRLRAGGSQSGVIRAQVELGKLDDRLRTLNALRVPLRTRLNAAMNRPHGAPLSWPREAPLAGAALDADKILEQFAGANPELSALDGMIRKEDRSIALARKEYFPDVTLGLDYIATDDALMAGTPDSGKDPVIAMVSVNLPIWRGKLKAGVEEARHRHRAAELMREDLSNVLESDLHMALYRFQDAGRKIDLYGDTLIPQSEQALRVTEEAYRTGTADFLDLIDAERLVLEFRLTHVRALADREIALAEVEKLAGVPLGSQSSN